MSIKQQSFIVLSLCDEESYGYDEHALPLLINLIDATNPDFRDSTHTGVVACYKTSPKNLSLIEQIVKQAETWRATDVKFSTLGIGLAEGELIAEFDWLGRIKGNLGPIGNARIEAAKAAQTSGKYRETLHALRERLLLVS